MARRHGYTDDQIANLADFEKRADFSPAEKTALSFAERMTVDPHNVDDALWNQMKQHFEEGEVIEIAAAVGLFNYFNRFNDALKMEPTK